jgi:autophagy-related protein 9
MFSKNGYSRLGQDDKDEGEGLEMSNLNTAHNTGPQARQGPAQSVSAASTRDTVVEYDSTITEKYGRWRHQRNVDRFFQRAYDYYRGKGYQCIVTACILDLLTILLVLWMLLFVMVCVDYQAMFDRFKKGYCGYNGNLVSILGADCNGRRAIDFHRLATMHGIVYFFLALIALCWMHRAALTLSRIPALSEMKKFFHQVLDIDDRSLQTITWETVLTRLSKAQSDCELSITVKELNELQITNMIMRKTHFIIGLFNEDIIDLNVNLPFLGKMICLPWSLEYSLTMILASLFKENSVLQEIKSNNLIEHQRLAATLRWYFRMAGVLNLLLAPAVLIYRIVVFCLTAGEMRATLSANTWSRYALWKLRNYCEVDHIFRHRLNKAYKPAAEYTSMFSSALAAVIARFLKFALTLFVVLTITGSFIFDDEFLLADLFWGRSVGWWSATFGVIIGGCQILIPNATLVYEPVKKMREIANSTHYLPDNWKKSEKQLDAVAEFGSFYQNKLVTLCIEILGIVFLTPKLLFFTLPDQALNIVLFYRRNVADFPGVGDVFAEAMLYRKEAKLDGHGSVLDSDIAFTRQTLRRRLGAQAAEARNAKHMHSIIQFQENHELFRADAPERQILERSQYLLQNTGGRYRDIHEMLVGGDAQLAHSIFSEEDLPEQYPSGLGAAHLQQPRQQLPHNHQQY